MPNLLAIETTTDVCAVALTGPKGIVERRLDGGRRHAEGLLGLVEDVMAATGVTRSDLEAVAVSMGPGSYTGLRIGVSTAKAIAAALGIPLVGVPSLEAAARVALSGGLPSATASPIIAAYPSRRSDVYAALFGTGDGTVGLLAGPLSGPPDTVLDAFVADGHTPGLIVGPGADRFTATDRLSIQPTTVSATAVAEIGVGLHLKGHHVDVEAFEPYYLNSFVAGVPSRTPFERLSF